MSEIQLSPEAFGKFQIELLNAESRGHSADAAVAIACGMIGISPKHFEKTQLVVDYKLKGTVWPFMEEDRR